jgi:RNA polymerase sigma-B factor
MPDKSQAERQRLLLRRYEQDRSESTRDELIEEFMPLARHLAARYSGSEPQEDLVQVACVGLIKAVDRFDGSRGNAFSSFAVPTILGELRRHFRDRGWSIRPPRDVQERVLKVEKAQAELPAKLGHTPTVAEIAEVLQLSDDEVLEALHAAQGHYANSLDAPTSSDDDVQSLGDRIGEDDPRYDVVESVVTLSPELRAIPHRDREILRLRFMEDLTQREIAERVGLSQMHVSRILRATLDRLREAIEAEDGIEPERTEGAVLALAS